MKLAVIGLGQCGSRIADEFAHLNRRARTERGIEIAPAVFAVNTDAADLSGLSHLKSDCQTRILIGGRKAGGHGVGKINEMGAEIARQDGDKVINAVRGFRQSFESDAFLLVASSGGGTGSGSVPVITKLLKDRYADKPVYALVVLPFEHEEKVEERTVYNTATCLKSVSSVADAVILVDNQRYLRKDSALNNNLAGINAQIVAPFYDLLCAGEEKKAKHIGAKVLDAGDIMQTIVGWTVVGLGRVAVSAFRFSLQQNHFRKKGTDTYRGVQAMNEAVSELSLQCDTKYANRAIYLLSAPGKEMNVALIKELSEFLRELAPNAIIRNGDYPREKGHVEVTVVLSALSDVEKIRNYYIKSTKLFPEYEKRQKETDNKLKEIEELGKEIPSLLKQE